MTPGEWRPLRCWVEEGRCGVRCKYFYINKVCKYVRTVFDELAILRGTALFNRRCSWGQGLGGAVHRTVPGQSRAWMLTNGTRRGTRAEYTSYMYMEVAE